VSFPEHNDVKEGESSGTLINCAIIGPR